jgi:hypothetical protein
MNHDIKKKRFPSDEGFVQSGLIADNIETIQSYSLLEEDEDLMPVAQREIDCAVSVLEAVYEKMKLLPYFIVPTRSGGIGMEYRLKGVEAYYHFDIDGSIDFSVINEKGLLGKTTFTTPAEAPGLIELV